MEVNIDIQEVLSEARDAFQNNDFSHALERYEYFFDHALDADPYSYYGVRLSYCLNEWAKLGAEYPPALVRLEQKAEESVRLLLQTKTPEYFHDFVSMCRYLMWVSRPIEQFLAIHDLDAELARSIVRFIWRELVSDERWTVCNVYLGNPMSDYQNCLAKFDRLLEFGANEPQLCDEVFKQDAMDDCVLDVTNILLVLLHNHRDAEFAEINACLDADMTARQHNNLPALIRANFDSAA
ncbi:MAG: hypothetical protein U1F46_03180 [Marinagarivorans sp.]